MAVVIVGILVLRMHALLALIIGAFCVALLTPTENLRLYADQKVAKSEWTQKTAVKFMQKPASMRVAEEFGRTSANLGILIAMATVLGEGMMLSGAAQTVARSMLRVTGPKRAHWAFFSSSFLLCIPVMLDTVMYLVAPLFKAVARQTRKDYLLLVMCTVAGGTITHSLVPPTPGPLFVAGELGVPLGTMIWMGSLIGIGAALVGVAFAHFSNGREVLEVPAEDPAQAVSPDNLPPLWMAMIPVLLPLLLIGLDASFSDTLRAEGSPLAPWVSNLGDKDMALTLGALSALAPLFFGWGTGSGAFAVQSAVNSGAAILLIIGAGGAFGGVLQQTGIAADIAHRFEGLHAIGLPLVFFVTMLVRTAQGSATVAMITAAPIAKALIAAGATTNPVYFAIAIGCGSKPFAWMNDAGFWIISKSSGLPESRMLRTVSPMMALQGFAGLIITMVFAWLFPLK